MALYKRGQEIDSGGRLWGVVLGFSTGLILGVAGGYMASRIISKELKKVVEETHQQKKGPGFSLPPSATSTATTLS